jgi:alpha-beta hydrolase superfamily lysophospholipase
MVRFVVAVLVVLVAVGYVVPSAVVAERLSRPTRRAAPGTPAEFGLAFEAVEFASLVDGVPLRGWWMPAARGDRAVAIVHGRNSTRAGSVTPSDLLRQAAALVAAGYGVLTFDLRAHGESGGQRYTLGPLERRDVGAAVAHLRGRGIATGRIGLLCHSMGAATCLLAGPDLPDVAAIWADSGYARLEDLLEAELPPASGLPRLYNGGILFLGRTLFGVDVAAAAPEVAVPAIGRPILFAHSLDDKLIPVEHASRLWRASGQPAERLWLVAGPSHDRVFDAQPEEYMRRALALFDGAMP